MEIARDAVKLAQSVEDKPKLVLSELRIGAKIIVRTKNSEYRFTKIAQDQYEAQGGWFDAPSMGGRFDAPIVCHIHGCTFGGSMLMTGRLCEGMRLEISFLDRPGLLTTSAIQDFSVI